MATTKPTRALSCHKCGTPADGRILVESDTDYTQRAGKRRVSATCICQVCHHRWQSVHPDAVARARALAKGAAA